MMRLGDIFPKLKLPAGVSRQLITGISDDSRLVKNGEIFFIIARKNFDIFTVLPQIEKKAAVLAADIRDRGRLDRGRLDRGRLKYLAGKKPASVQIKIEAGGG